MKYGKADQFDDVMDSAIFGKSQDLVEFYDQIDVSDVVVSKRLDARVYRLIAQKANERIFFKTKRVFSRPAFVAIFVMALLLAMLMSVSAVRDKVWGVLVEWFETHVSVQYDVPEAADASDAGVIARSRVLSLNDSVSTLRKPRAVAEGIEEVVLQNTSAMTFIEYRDGEAVIYKYTQKILTSQENIYDEGCIISETTVNGVQAVMLQYPEGKNRLVWDDGTYLYKLDTEVLSLEELLILAESVS